MTYGWSMTWMTNMTLIIRWKSHFIKLYSLDKYSTTTALFAVCLPLFSIILHSLLRTFMYWINFGLNYISGRPISKQFSYKIRWNSTLSDSAKPSASRSRSISFQSCSLHLVALPRFSVFSSLEAHALLSRYHVTVFH